MSEEKGTNFFEKLLLNDNSRVLEVASSFRTRGVVSDEKPVRRSRMSVLEKMVRYGYPARREPLVIAKSSPRWRKYRQLYKDTSTGQIYLANVKPYRRVTSLFKHSLQVMLEKQAMEVILILGVDTVLWQGYQLFLKNGSVGFKVLFWSVIIASFFYLLLGLKLFPTLVLTQYTAKLHRQNAIDCQDKLLASVENRYQILLPPTTATAYYYELKQLSRLLDTERSKKLRLRLLLAHLVDLRQEQDLECGQLLGNYFRLEAIYYLSYLAYLDSDKIDRAACDYLLTHQDDIKSCTENELIHWGELATLALACLQFYPQLSSVAKEKMKTFVQQPQLTMELSRQQAAFVKQVIESEL